MLPFIRSNNSINPEESYKTIENYGFDKDALCMFIQSYEVVKEIKERNGTHFNKVGPNINVTGKGCYFIPYWDDLARRGYRNVRNLFYKYCAYHLFYGKMEEYKTDNTDNFINFAQYLPKISPLCLDFDIVTEFKKSDRDKFKRGDSIHIYKQEHIFKIVEILNNIIFDNFDIEKEDIKAYVFEKESFKFKSAEEVKDGLHIIYLLPFNVKQRWFIRQELINKLKEINFNKSFDFKVTNEYNDIVDEAVITRNPWLTYGSVKVETKTVKDINGNTVYYTNKKGEKKKKQKFIRSTAYTLSYIFDFNLFDENVDCMGNRLTYETIDDIEGMLNMFDLDQFSDNDPLEEKSDKLINYRIDEKIKTVSNNQTNTIDTYNTNDFTTNNNTNDFTIINNKKTGKKYDIRKLTPKILQNIIKDLVRYDINYNYNNWIMICGAIRNCTLICFNGDEKKAKDYVHYFCKQDKGFCKDNFEDDYENIKKASNEYQSKQCNIRTLIEHIYDPNKVNEYDKCLEKDKKVKDYKLTNSYSFNNYKKNNYSNMDSSDSYTEKEKVNNNQLSIIDYYNEIENEYYEHYKNDDIEIKPEKIPELIINQGKLFKPLQYELLHNERFIGVSKNDVKNIICCYLFRLVLYIQGEGNFYVYDFEDKVYICKTKTLAFQYIYDKDLDFSYFNKEGRQKTVTINPKKLYLSYIDFNHWERRRDINQPKLYKEIKLVNGEELESKNIFNDGPSIPSYLTENYKSFDEYGQKYKDFVKGFFLLLKYSLCDGKEEDYEYLKNWVINKALFKRNRTVLVLQSPGQGIGKSTVAQMIKAMCEDKYVSIGNKCDWLNEKFNSILKDKILIGIEEMTVSDSKAVWKTMLNRMKDLTTNSSMVLEFKGEEPFDADIEFDFVITSNYYNNFANDVENRRYFIPNVTANKYKEIPIFKPEILETRPIIIKENGIVKRINEIKNIEQLCKYLNSIIINKGNSDVPLTKQEKRKYFRCFYAYCNENKNEEFEPSFMPITDEIKHSADKTMKFIYKYIKIKELYGKNHLIIKKDKEGNIISSNIKFITTDIKYDIKDFAYSLYKNECTLKRYNYLNSCVYEFIKEIGLREKKSEASEITSQKINEFFKRYINDFVKYKYVKSRKNNCYVFECSYNELLEFYKSNGYIIDSEYEKLKSNYDVLEYCDYDDYSISNISYYDQINELKLKLNEKDVLLKKYDEELKEKDRIIQQLESFKDEYKDKEIEKLKSSNNDLNTINTSLNTKISELENSNNDLNKIIAELKAKINELENSNNELNTINTNLNTKISELENSNNELNTINTNLNTKISELEKLPIDNNKIIEIENLKKECKLALNNEHTIHKLRKLFNRYKKLGFKTETDKQTIEYKMKELEILLAKFIEIKI